MYIKKIEPHNQGGLLDEVEGVIQGHRDGHGYLVRDDGEPDIYLPPNEMRAVLHRDRVKARIVRHDRRGRAEGRVVEIVERPAQPIIGRLLHESGVWLVAPEDKRYGQDVLIPKGATGLAKTGQVVVVELTEPPSLYGQPVGRIGAYVGSLPEMVLVRRGPMDGLWAGVVRVGEVSALSLRLLGRMLVGELSLRNLSGPIAIADYAGKSASLGLTYYLAFLAFISVSLGVLNLLPLPVLDGGHLMYYLWEAVTGRPVGGVWMERLQYVGMSLLLAMMAIAMYNDIVTRLG